MLKLRPTYKQMLKEAKTRRLKILPERERRSSSGILLDDVDFDEFHLSIYDKRIDINNNNNPDKATQTDFNLASYSSSSVSDSVRTPDARTEPRELRDATQSPRVLRDEAVKETEEEVSEASSIRSVDKTVERERGEAQKQKSLMRRMFDSRFEEVEVELPGSRQVSVATEQSKASSSSLPMNVKKSYEPSSSSSSSRRSSGRSALLPVEEGALSEYGQSSPPETINSSVPSRSSRASGEASDATVEYLQSSPPVSVASSERTIEYIRSRSSSGRSR